MKMIFSVRSLLDPLLIFRLLKEKIDKNEFKKLHIVKQLICKKQNIFFVSINTNHFQSSINCLNIVVSRWLYQLQRSKRVKKFLMKKHKIG